MAWLYSDYITLSDPAAALARLNSHIQEVSDKITADVSADGKSRSSQTLKDYLDMLLKRRDSLSAAVSGIAGNRTLATFPRR